MTQRPSIRWILSAGALAFSACSGGVSHDDASVSDDALLSGLTVSGANVVPAFSDSTSSYAAKLSGGATEFRVTPTARNPNASIELQQDDRWRVGVTSGKASLPLPAPAVGGSSKIAIRVTAEDGMATRSYELTVTVAERTKEPDAGPSSDAGPGPGPGPDAGPGPTTFTVYSVGDSTMADYDVNQYPNQRGWGQMFPQFLKGNVGFVNAARNGRSSKSFYVEGLWNAVRAKLKKGDYVFIQFGHNDEKDNGLEGDGGIGTEPRGAYQTYLTRYVDETLDGGATPVLFTPVVRRYFSGNTLTAAASHDLTGNGTAVGNASYPDAMKEVGTRKGVTVIDLTGSTKQLVEQFGPTNSKSSLYIIADDTHLQPTGAMLFAQLAAKGLVDAGVLADSINPATDLVLSPTAIDFGALLLEQTSSKVVSITGLSLFPPEGNVTISAPDGFQVSATATGVFGPTLTLTYSGGLLSPTTFFVRFAPTAAKAYEAALSVAVVGGTPKTVNVRGSGLAVSDGGVPSTALYLLTSGPGCSTTGAVTCAEETLTGLDAGYGVPNATLTTWTSDTGATLVPSSTVTQRLFPIDGTWPSESGVNPGRYAEVTLSPSAGKSLTVDQVKLWVGAAGGNNIGYELRASTQADFGNPIVLVTSPSGNAKNAMIYRTLQSSVRVNAGESLRLRLYPWWSSSVTATGKYICIQSLEIHGVAE